MNKVLESIKKDLDYALELGNDCQVWRNGMVWMDGDIALRGAVIDAQSKIIKALTPPNKEELKAEIIKELNEMGIFYNFELLDENGHKGFITRHKDTKIELYIGVTTYDDCENMNFRTNMTLPLSLASKIIEFFQRSSENE